MNNLFAQSRSHWVRYDRYEIKTGKDGKRYITPEKAAKPDIYNPLKDSSEMVLEALNVGMLMMNRSPEDEVEKAVLAFVTHYGLLGLMTAHHAVVYGLRGGLSAEESLHQGRKHGDRGLSCSVLSLRQIGCGEKGRGIQLECFRG